MRNFQDISFFLDNTLFTIRKPGRYVGGEFNQVKKNWSDDVTSVALVFPDIYDIGQSNLGIAILYDIINRRADALAERVFAPWADMETAMRSSKIPLFSLENRKPLNEFDIVGVSIPYETLYTNVLNLLDLGNVSLRSGDRNENEPIVLAGGHACFNPEPMNAFIDAFIIGEGEEVVLEILDIIKTAKRNHWQRGKKISEIGRLPGIYIPGDYEITYQEDGTVKEIIYMKNPEIGKSITKRIVKALPPPLVNQIVPNIGIVHDRVAIEVMRGCSRGCRFCQAGMINRPVRERPADEILTAVETVVGNTGYEEVSLLSLSTSDHSEIRKIIIGIGELSNKLQFNFSLPSLRIESFDTQLMTVMDGKKKGNFTLAPEAASETIRQSINKPISDGDLFSTVENIIQKGWRNLKLYFMIGFPDESLEDAGKIVDLCQKVIHLAKEQLKGRIEVHVGINTLIPKPHTPFQWAAMQSTEIIEAKYQLIREGLRKSKLKIDWPDYRNSFFEAWFSRGDRRLSAVIETAWRKGAKFDAWQEHFNYDLWLDAFRENGIDPFFYSHRKRSHDELFPWEHINSGVSKKFLLYEYQKSQALQTSQDCQIKCHNCGIQTSFDISCKDIRGPH